VLCVYSVDLVHVLCGTCVEHVSGVEHVWISRELYGCSVNAILNMC